MYYVHCVHHLVWRSLGYVYLVLICILYSELYMD
jgi:hypothetical protein